MARSRKQSLQDEKAALQRRLKEIHQELSRMEPQPSMSLHHPAHRNTLNDNNKSDSPIKPLRQIIIEMLSDVGYMLTNTTIRHLYESKFHKGLAASRLGTLSFDEQKRKNKWNTTVYGLTHPIQLAEAEIVRVKNIWARSDWLINRRIYLPVTERLINLHFLDWYITTSGSKRYRYLSSPTMLRYVEGVVNTLDLNPNIQSPYDSAHAKKIIVKEIEQARELEKTKYSSLAFKILATYKQTKKHYDPDMYADTNMNT